MTRTVGGEAVRQEVRQLAGHEVPLVIRRSARARRLALRIDSVSGGVELVLPRRATLAEAEAFFAEQSDWILAKIEEVPPRIPFAGGAVLPVLGRECRICHLPLLPPEVRREGDDLVVGGSYDRLAARLTSWFVALAREVLSTQARVHAARLEREIAGITVRDPRTRWGSCSPRGRLSFSWRLVLAPTVVLDYVVAHEVAHLKELNHGPRFWALVESLCPGHQAPRRWLRDNAHDLLRYG